MMTRMATLALLLAACLPAAEADAKQRSAKDQALYEKAWKDCKGPHYPSGARPYINYSGGWYRCQEPGDNR